MIEKFFIEWIKILLLVISIGWLVVCRNCDREMEFFGVVFCYWYFIDVLVVFCIIRMR